jgi:WhiB family transcriptional regulator, redox-sensing transcriptional regulator
MPRLRCTLTSLDGDSPISWPLRGLCRHHDPDLFFSDNEADIDAAKAICWRCPVRVECLSLAIEGNMSGVWGATTHVQRMRLKWRRVRTYCPVCRSSLVVSERAGPRRGQLCVACGTSWKA